MAQITVTVFYALVHVCECGINPSLHGMIYINHVYNLLGHYRGQAK